MICQSHYVLAGWMFVRVAVLYLLLVWLHGSSFVCGVCPLNLVWLLKGRSGVALTQSSSSSCNLCMESLAAPLTYPWFGPMMLRATVVG